MKYSLDAGHLQYFQKHRLLELEKLLSDAQRKLVMVAVNETLLKRTQRLVQPLTAEDEFMEGHDLWRSNALLAKTVCNSQWAEIAAELNLQRTVRLGNDQWFPLTPPSSTEPSLYNQLLSKTTTLTEISCLQGVSCGLMLCIEGYGSDEKYEGVFSLKPGNAVSFAADRPIDFPTLRQRPGQKFLMITYTDRTALYVVNESDPHHHELKKFGYVFGDRLNDRLNPILKRT